MKTHRPWTWVPTLYFAEGIPYFVVNNISTILFKKMGMSNADMALYTSLLYLPWLIKPFWSPFVDILKTKRWWVVTMEALMVILFLGLTVTLPRPEITAEGTPVSVFTVTLALFWITAFASATHDIAADGFYMLGLSDGEQAFFVGIRSTTYRLANLFVQGALVVFAGVVELRSGDIPHSWRMTLLLTSGIWAALALYHLFILPRPASDRLRKTTRTGDIFREFGRTFATFFRKPLSWLGIVFMLLYRLPEAFALKIVPAFLVDHAEAGGMALSTVNYGLINNTVGVIGIVLGGILGGMAISRWGLRKALWPMALSLALPCVVYWYMAVVHTVPLWVIGTCVFIEQFGYGFGFTAYMLYMIYISEGEFKTSHYSLCTAFMAASMMLPGMVAGLLEEAMGYPAYFGFVMACCLATVTAVLLVRRGIPETFGKNTH
ncbi:MAG: MFS transporter [Bacteroidales bacterium]|nr:MFS transporter [Bacteroidales bacterium]